MARFTAAARASALLLLASTVSAYPHLQHEFRQRLISPRQANITNTYDFIIVGGGQSGLVVANRLSQDPNVTVLVVEYGYFDDRIAQLQPASATKYPPQDLFNLTSVPQVGLENSRQAIYSAAVVGGGSTINGMMLNRGAADDYNNWEKLNNPGWGWHDLFPYFVKSTVLHAPSPTLQKEFNITWNASSYGNGPIHVSFAPYQWPAIKTQWKGLMEMGLEPQLDGADGHGYGAYWFVSALDNRTMTRSYARNQYYDPVRSRPNLQLLVGWRVNEITFNRDTKHATGIVMQERNAQGDSGKATLRARKEIILTAGSLHSPQILQRSGVGPAPLLKQAGVNVLVDLAGVGSNLQDHPVGRMSFQLTTDVFPNPTDSRNNATFAAWIKEEWQKHRRGPDSVTVGNTAGLVPLKQISPTNWQKIVDMYKAQDLKTVLPANYTAEQIKGYDAQRALLADSMTRLDNAFLEFPIQAGGASPIVYIKQISRGTILLNTTNIYAEPVVDYHTFVNPVDAHIAVESLRFVRRYWETPSAKTLGPVEQAPGKNITSDDALLEAVRRSTGSTAAHLSGTNAMMPRDLGGVVSPELLVYGVSGISVADSSIMPMIPGAHICATVYAVAEKAADLIKARHGLKH